MKISINIIFSIFLVISCKNHFHKTGTTSKANKPNIIIFYVDDLGFGDLSSYGAICVQTPNVDKLANGGIRFTDAHSAAATCTPSRYSLLTGEFAFRNKAEILPGDAPLLINIQKPTLPKMLQKAGYKTAVVGKWHLGLGDGNVDWNNIIKPGPLEIGFNYSFLLPATGDRVPTVFIENHKALNLDLNDPIQINYEKPFEGIKTGITNPELLRQKADAQHSQAIVNGISRIGYQKGGNSALWTDEDFPFIFTEKASNFIEENKANPFFLFFSFHDIHVPRLPNQQFQGKSTMGPRGDAIVQMDWITGQIINKLKELGLAENTLILFTSDNGPVLDDGYFDNAQEMLGNHKPGGPFRGGKYSSFEAGTRVPLIAYWPQKIKPGVSKSLISQIDFYKSFASLLSINLETNEAIDSQNVLDALINSESKGRNLLLEESFALSVREGSYKYIAPLEKKQFPTWLKNKKVEAGIATIPQLYNLEVDVNEQTNIADSNPNLVSKLQSKIDSIVAVKTK